MAKDKNKTNSRSKKQHSDKELREYYKAYYNVIEKADDRYKISFPKFKVIFGEVCGKKMFVRFDSADIMNCLDDIEDGRKKEIAQKEKRKSEKEPNGSEKKRSIEEAERKGVPGDLAELRCEDCYYILRGRIEVPHLPGCLFNPNTKKCRLDGYLKVNPKLEKKAGVLEKKLEKERKVVEALDKKLEKEREPQEKLRKKLESEERAKKKLEKELEEGKKAVEILENKLKEERETVEKLQKELGKGLKIRELEKNLEAELEKGRKAVETLKKKLEKGRKAVELEKKLEKNKKAVEKLQKKWNKRRERKVGNEIEWRAYERHQFHEELLSQWLDNMRSDNAELEHPLMDNAKRLFISAIPPIGGRRKETVFIFNYPGQDTFISNPGRKGHKRTFGCYKGMLLDDHELRTLLKPEPYPWYSIEVDFYLLYQTTVEALFGKNIRPVRKLIQAFSPYHFFKEERGRPGTWYRERNKKIIELWKDRKTAKEISDILCDQELRGHPMNVHEDTVKNALRMMKGKYKAREADNPPEDQDPAS